MMKRNHHASKRHFLLRMTTTNNAMINGVPRIIVIRAESSQRFAPQRKIVIGSTANESMTSVTKFAILRLFETFFFPITVRCSPSVTSCKQVAANRKNPKKTCPKES